MKTKYQVLKYFDKLPYFFPARRLEESAKKVVYTD